MTEGQARALEERWGSPGPAPNSTWRCCWRCGEWLPSEARLWCMPHRLCRACKNDEKRGIWPYKHAWHRKNRWDATGHLERRCCICKRWKPLTAYYLIHKTDKPRSAQTYAYATCIPCAIARKGKLPHSTMRRSLAA